MAQQVANVNKLAQICAPATEQGADCSLQKLMKSGAKVKATRTHSQLGSGVGRPAGRDSSVGAVAPSGHPGSSRAETQGPTVTSSVCSGDTPHRPASALSSAPLHRHLTALDLLFLLLPPLPSLPILPRHLPPASLLPHPSSSSARLSAS